MNWVVERLPGTEPVALAAGENGVWIVVEPTPRGTVLHRQGSQWVRARLPRVNDVKDVSAGDVVWVLADGKLFRRTHGRWTTVSPGALPDGSELSALDARGRSIWVVGGYDASTADVDDTGYLAVRGNGGRWRAYTGDPGLAPWPKLESVSVLSPTDAWAVGYEGGFSQTTSELTLHWNGSRWGEMRDAGEVTELTDVLAVGDQEAWAIGRRDTASPDSVESRVEPLLEHRMGSRRIEVRPVGPSGVLTLHALAGTSPDDVWLAIEKRGSRAPYLAHWDGKRWRLSTAPPVSAPILNLAVGRGRILWAAGSGFVAHSGCG